MQISSTKPLASSAKYRGLGLALLAVLVIIALLTGLMVWRVAWRPPTAATPPALDSQALSQTEFEEAAGVRVTLVAVTGQGGLIDVRYQVLDPDKAVIVHDPDKPLTIVDEATGQTFDTPWMQHATHSGPLNPGVTYYLILVNPKGVIQRGHSVSVVIGDYRLEHILVK